MPDFAACLDLGLQPVGLVQGFCVMRWGWYGAGSGLHAGHESVRAAARRATGPTRRPTGARTGSCRTSTGCGARTWSRPGSKQAWSDGYGSAYSRMLEEATALGAHGVIGVVDRVTHLADTGTTEFHFLGTAIKVEDGPPPAGGVPWTTYLAGQRLTKSIEAGFMPVAVVASMASVRVWAYCMTEYLMEGSRGWGGPTSPYEVEQVSKAHMAVRQLARKHVRQQLVGRHAARGPDRGGRSGSSRQGDEVIDCTLRGNRMRRFKDFDVVPPPRPTVRLT